MNKASRGPPSAPGEVRLEAAWSELSDSLEPSFFSDQARSRSRVGRTAPRACVTKPAGDGSDTRTQFKPTNWPSNRTPAYAFCESGFKPSQDLPTGFAEKYWLSPAATSFRPRSRLVSSAVTTAETSLLCTGSDRE